MKVNKRYNTNANMSIKLNTNPPPFLLSIFKNSIVYIFKRHYRLNFLLLNYQAKILYFETGNY